MSIKTGTKDIVFPPHSHVRILAESRCSLVGLDDKNKPCSLLATDVDGVIRFRTGDQEVNARVNVQGDAIWSFDIDPEYAFDKADPVPVELPDDARPPESLEEKLKRFVGEMVAHRFGEDSEQMETLEEALDFGDDEHEIPPLSGYEVTEMESVEPEIDSGQEPTQPVADTANVPDPGSPEKPVEKPPEKEAEKT